MRRAMHRVDLWSRVSGTVYVRREVPIGGLIPDMVFVAVNGTPNGDPKPRRWTLRHSGIAWALRTEGPLSIDEVSAAVSESTERVLPIVNELIDARLIRTSNSGKITLVRNSRLLRSEVIAVELKLSRWKEALLQAQAYRTFADRVVVALDGERVNPDSAPFKQEGIGLALVRRRGVELAVAPRPRELSGLSLEHDYVVGSALWSNGHTLWRRRNAVKASSQAWT
jgi:hypothetical protein